MFKRFGSFSGKKNKTLSILQTFYMAYTCLYFFTYGFCRSINLKFWNCYICSSLQLGQPQDEKSYLDAFIRCFFSIIRNRISWCSVKRARKYSFTSSGLTRKVSCGTHFFTLHMLENSKEQSWGKASLQSRKIKSPQNTSCCKGLQTFKTDLVAFSIDKHQKDRFSNPCLITQFGLR